MAFQQRSLVIPVAVIQRDDSLLLVFKHSSSFAHCVNKWQLPGSRTKKGQVFDEALTANTKTLLGVDITVGEPLGMVHTVTSDDIAMHIILVRCGLESEDFKLETRKLREANWFTLKEIEDLHDKGELVDIGDLETARLILT